MPDALVMLPELEKWECLASDPFQISSFERVARSLSTWKKDGNSPKGRSPKDNNAQCCPVTIFSWYQRQLKESLSPGTCSISH